MNTAVIYFSLLKLLVKVFFNSSTTTKIKGIRDKNGALKMRMSLGHSRWNTSISLSLQAKHSVRGNKRSIPYPSWRKAGLDYILLTYYYVLIFIQFRDRVTSASSNHRDRDGTFKTQLFFQHKSWGHSLHKSHHKAYVYSECVGQPFCGSLFCYTLKQGFWLPH